MEKLSYWNRLFGNLISVGMLIGVLLFSGCRTSKESLTTVRSDSMRYNVTVVSTIEPVRKKMKDLVLSPDHLTRLTHLPKGYSIQAASDNADHVNLRIESLGDGGLNIIAESTPLVYKRDSITEEIETRIRDETYESKKNSTGFFDSLDNGTILLIIVFLLIYIKNK